MQRIIDVAFSQFNQELSHDKRHHQSQRERNVTTLTIPLERRFKFKVQEVRLSLRNLSGYILACFLNPACDVFKVTRGIWLRIDSCLKTRHFIQTKERSLNKKGWHLKNTAEDLFHTPNTTYNVQLLRNAYVVLLILPISKVQ